MLTVVSGAGLSAASPARAPLGDELRDAYMDAIIKSSSRSPWKDVDEMGRHDAAWSSFAGWRLETLVGMVHAVVGGRAFEPLNVVRRGEPNRAHQLAADLLHSGKAPVHLTFNFDDFIERAAESKGLHVESLSPEDGSRLETLASEDWSTLVTPVIVHLHGRVLPHASRRFPGLVVTLDTIQGPAPGWLVALLERAFQSDVLVTGYSGFDTDVWPALLHAAEEGDRSSQWTWNSLDAHAPGSATYDELHPRGFAFSGGGAVAALSSAMGRPESSNPDRGPFDPAEVAHLLRLEDSEAGLILAWILEDIGGQGRDRAREVLGSEPPGDAPDGVQWRWWMKLGTVRRDGGEHRAALPYLRKARRSASSRGTRASLRLDESECYRHLLFHNPPLTRPFALLRMALALILARWEARRTKERDEISKRSARIRGHALLRILDGAPTIPRMIRLSLARAATASLRHATSFTDETNPHTTMFAYLQLAEALSYVKLAGGDASLLDAGHALQKARAMSSFIAQPLGRGNSLAAAGLVELAAGDFDRAEHWFAQAESVYESAGHQSGLDLIQKRRHLLEGLRRVRR